MGLTSKLFVSGLYIYKENIHFKFNNFDFIDWKIAKKINMHTTLSMAFCHTKSKANGSMV